MAYIETKFFKFKFLLGNLVPWEFNSTLLWKICMYLLQVYVVQIPPLFISLFIYLRKIFDLK